MSKFKLKTPHTVESLTYIIGDINDELDFVECGGHATESRDFGRGMAFLSERIRALITEANNG